MALRISGLAKVATDPEMVDVGDQYRILKCRIFSDRVGMFGKRNEGVVDDFPMELFGRKDKPMPKLNLGDKIYVEGRLIMDQYKHEGQPRKSYMVVAEVIRPLGGTTAPTPEPKPEPEPDPMDSADIPF